MVDDLTGDYLKSNRCIYSIDFDHMCGKKASIYLCHTFNSYGRTASKKIYLCSCAEHGRSFPKDTHIVISKEEYSQQFDTLNIENYIDEHKDVVSKNGPENEWEEFIWSKPMNLLAKELNVSIPTLRKRCSQLNVRTPPVGHWSKK